MINHKELVNALYKNSGYTPELPLTYLENSLVEISKMQLVKNNKGLYDAKETLRKCKETNVDLVYRIQFLYLLPRSRLIKNQGKEPRLGTLTPLALYAHKLYNDVKYEEWDKESTHIRYFLGKYLENILEYRTTSITGATSITRDEAIQMRKDILAYKTGTRKGQMEKLTSYKCTGATMDANATRILAQTWLANVQVRVPDAMILDLENWDRTPEAFDEKVIKEEKVIKNVSLYEDII